MQENLSSKFIKRQYMLSKDFEIYYFNDINVTSVKDHTHPYYEFYIFIGGDITMCIGDQTYPMQKGDVILIPPGTKHHLINNKPDTPYQRFIFWITPEYCNQLMQISSDYGYVMQQVIVSHNYYHHYDVLAFNTLQGKVFALLDEIHANRFGKTAKITLCVDDLVLHLNRTIYNMEHPNQEKEVQSLFENVVSFIDRHIEDPMTLDSIANNFYVSKYHISHIFKDHLGISVHQYILKRRLSLARDAIASNMEISEAYLKCGFNDYSSFFRAFRKEFGMSPKEYREYYRFELEGSNTSSERYEI